VSTESNGIFPMSAKVMAWCVLTFFGLTPPSNAQLSGDLNGSSEERMLWTRVLTRYAGLKSFKEICSAKLTIFGLSAFSHTTAVYEAPDRVIFSVFVREKRTLTYVYTNGSGSVWLSNRNEWQPASSLDNFVMQIGAGTDQKLGYWGLTALRPFSTTNLTLLRQHD
jgi:hypothetical protein